MAFNTPAIPLTPAQKAELIILRERFNNALIALMQSTGTSTAHLDLSQVWEETNHLPKLYSQLSELKSCLHGFRPFSPNMGKALNDVLDIQYTYESNSIEGNSLTLGETEAVIKTGLTVKGKPLVDHLEVTNHQEAIHYIRDLATKNSVLSEKEIKKIQSLVLTGIDFITPGEYRKTSVYTTKPDRTVHEFPLPLAIPGLMEQLFDFFEKNKNNTHPVAMASHLHQKLVNIHPFGDGNGRTGRLLMNLYLLQSGYPIAIIESEISKRMNYYNLLADYNGVVDGGDSEPFQRFIALKVKEVLLRQLAFCAEDLSVEGNGYEFFKKIEPLLGK